MASHNLIPYLLLLLSTLPIQIFASDSMIPFNCSITVNTCSAFLYHINKLNLQQQQIAGFYNVSSANIIPILRGNTQDYLISMTASCKNVNGTTAYFYDVPYTVQENDTFVTVSEQIYSGQAWIVGDEQSKFIAGNVVSMHLLSGCIAGADESRIVTTYSVQQNDTVIDIADRLGSTAAGIQSLNSQLITDPNLLVEGWVLFVPMQLTQLAPSPPPSN